MEERDGLTRVDFADGRSMTHDELREGGAIAYAYRESSGEAPIVYYDNETFLSALREGLAQVGGLKYKLLSVDDKLRDATVKIVLDRESRKVQENRELWLEGTGRMKLVDGSSISRNELKETGAIAYISWNEGVHGHDIMTYHDKDTFLRDLRNEMDDRPLAVNYGILSDNGELEKSARDVIRSLYGPTAEEWAADGAETPDFHPDDEFKKVDIVHTPEGQRANEINSTLASKHLNQGASSGSASMERAKPYSQLNTERVLHALKSETAPFLRKNSEMDQVTLMPEAIRSAVTGRAFRGMNQILAQIMIQEMGGKDKELITYEQTKRHNAGIKKGSQGLTLSTYDIATNVQKDYRYYPVSAVYSRENLPTIPAPEKNPGMVVSCIDTIPEKYLGKYLAATSLGARFETSAETMKVFAQNMIATIEAAYAEKRYTKIYEIGNKASVICQNTMSEIGTRVREAERIQQSIVSSRSSLEPHNPVTGEKFQGMNGKKAAYVMERRESKDPRFLELSDILKAGLSLKEEVKEPLIISDNGKSRFFYNAKDIDGIPPMKEPRKIPLQRRIITQEGPKNEQEMGL